jgi:hypothetical protein
MAVYISKQSGLWSSASTWLTAAAGTLTPTADAGQAPQSGGGDKIVIARNHIVTYDLIGEFGDQTSTYVTTIASNISANAICLSGGTLKASRTNNTGLTARGTIIIAQSGTLDWGTTIDPLTTTSNIVLNYHTNAAILSTSSGAAGIYLYGSGTSNFYNNIYINGLNKKRNTYLTVSANNGSNVISVESVSGWNIGDKLLIQSELLSSITSVNILSALSSTIVGITGLNVEISPVLNISRSSGRAVSNFSGNINITSFNRLYPSYGIFLVEGASSIIDINNIVLRDIGYTAGWYNYGNGSVAGSIQTTTAPAALTKAIDNQTVSYTHKSIAIDQTTTVNNNSIVMNGGIPDYTNFNDCCIYNNGAAATNIAFNFNNGVLSNITNCNVFKVPYGYSNGTSVSKTLNFSNCIFDCTNNFTHSNGTNTLVAKFNSNNCNIRSVNGIVGILNANFNFNNCYLEYTKTDGLLAYNDSAYGSLYIKESTLNGGKLKTTASNNIKTTKDFNAWFYNPTTIATSLSSINKYTRFNSDYYADSDFSTRKRGLNSYRIRPERTNTKFEVYETIPVNKGVANRIKGSLRFDSNYGSSNPPSISFVGGGINTTFTCTSTVNTWQDFDYNFIPTLTDDIIVTITGQSTLTSGYIWLDGATFYPIVQEVRHYGFVFDFNQYRTVNTLNTLTENQVSALANIQNLDYLYDAVTYWSVTNPSLSSYIDLVTVNGSLLDFSSRNIVINNTGTAFDYNSATNTITLDAPTLSAGTNFNSIKTTGTITLSTGLISNLNINANIIQTIPTNLTGIYMLSSTNTLAYNTNTPIEVEYTNCTMVGVKNDGTAIITIKRTNSTVTESDAEIVTYAPTLINLTLQGGYIALYDDNSNRQYYQNTDGTIVLPANATGTWSYKVARYGYQLISGTFNVNPALGGIIDISPNYIPDTFINELNITTVSAYTDLNTVAKIHDYLSYYLTTSTGIDYGILDSESFGVLSFYGNLIMSSSATNVVDYNLSINTLKLKSSSLNDDYIFVVLSSFTTDGVYTLGDNLKIRANNLDSELYFNNVDSIVFYPTESDRDNNTNAGLSASGTIYRYKYGSTINGVTFSDYIYCRITIGTSIILNKTAITNGSTTIDFGTVNNIQAILANQRIINTGVQKASKLIPHTTNI